MQQPLEETPGGVRAQACDADADVVWYRSINRQQWMPDLEVPFAYPRAPELRFEPEFAEVAGRVSGVLRGAHA